MLAWGGCALPAVKTEMASPAAVPASWRNAPAGAVDNAALAEWWQQFRDPALTRLVEIALDASPDLQTAKARIDQFQAILGTQTAGLFPQLSASATAQGTETRLRNPPVTTRTETYGPALQASWQVDLFGRERQGRNAAVSDLARQVELYHGAEVTLAAQVATTYLSLRGAEAQLQALQESILAQEQTTQLARWREEAGTATELDTQQALSNLEQARAAISDLETTIEQARNQLALLCGRPPGAVDDLLVKPAGIPVAPTAIAVSIPAETLQQRPDVRGARRSAEAEGARLTAARRQRFPSLDLSGSIGLEARSAGRIFSPEIAVSNAAASLTAPIFDAGLIRQTIAVQGAVEQQALMAYQSTVLTALKEVENALIAIRRSEERSATLHRAVVAAQEASNLAAAQYQAGQANLIVVLQAQQTLLAVKEQEAATQASLASAEVQLYQALGGGWQTSTSSRTQP